MSELSDLKNLLRVTHDEDDALLTLLIGAAARECIAY
nr:phage head-tail connector protein [Alicycliphilus sp.]